MEKPLLMSLDNVVNIRPIIRLNADETQHDVASGWSGPAPFAEMSYLAALVHLYKPR